MEDDTIFDPPAQLPDSVFRYSCVEGFRETKLQFQSHYLIATLCRLIIAPSHVKQLLSFAAVFIPAVSAAECPSSVGLRTTDVF